MLTICLCLKGYFSNMVCYSWRKMSALEVDGTYCLFCDPLKVPCTLILFILYLCRYYLFISRVFEVSEWTKLFFFTMNLDIICFTILTGTNCVGFKSIQGFIEIEGCLLRLADIPMSHVKE